MMRHAFACVALAGTAGLALAQDWSVTRLRLGRTAPAEVEVGLALAGQAEPAASRLRRGQVLREGTRLVAPAEVEISVADEVGTEELVKRQGKPGELLLRRRNGAADYQVVRGGFSLKSAVRQFEGALAPTASAGPVRFSPMGTQFEIEVSDAGDSVSLTVQTGAVQVDRRQQVQVAGAARTGVVDAPRQVVKAGEPTARWSLVPEAHLLRYGSFDEAESAFQAQVRRAEAQGEPGPLFDSLLALGDVYQLIGRPAEALASYERAAGLLKLPADTYWQAVLLGRRGDALLDARRLGEALQAYQGSIALHRRLPPREGEAPVLEQTVNVVRALEQQGVLTCADRWAARLLGELDAGGRRWRFMNHVRVPLLLTRAHVLQAAGQGAAALGLGEQALDLQRQVSDIYPHGNEDRLQVLLTLAQAQFDTQQAGLASTTLSQAERDAQALFPMRHPVKAELALARAWQAQVRGQSDASLASIAQALAQLDPQQPDRLLRGQALLQRATLAQARGDAASALADFRAAREDWLALDPSEAAPRHQQVLDGLAWALGATGAPADELAAVREAGRRRAQALQALEQACPA